MLIRSCGLGLVAIPSELSVPGKKRQERKNRVFQTSKELFFQNGYENVTVKDICDALDSGKSAIYSHFQSKEEIYAYIKLEAVQKLAAVYDSLLPPEQNQSLNKKTAEKLFQKAGLVLFEFSQKEEPYYKALFLSANAALHGVPDTLKEKIAAQSAGARKPFQDFTEALIWQGIFKKIHIESFTRMYYTTITGIINDFLLHEDYDSASEIQDACTEHIALYFQALTANT